MVSSCSVPGCKAKSGADSPYKFFTFPKANGLNLKKRELRKRRRSAWYKALRRKDFTEDEIGTRRICSKHFISGRPAHIEDETNPDWVPSLCMGHVDKRTHTKYINLKKCRLERYKQRQEKNNQSPKKRTVTDRRNTTTERIKIEMDNESYARNEIFIAVEGGLYLEEEDEIYLKEEDDLLEDPVTDVSSASHRPPNPIHLGNTALKSSEKFSCGVQTDISCSGVIAATFLSEYQERLNEIRRLKKENILLKEQLAKSTLEKGYLYQQPCKSEIFYRFI